MIGARMRRRPLFGPAASGLWPVVAVLVLGLGGCLNISGEPAPPGAETLASVPPARPSAPPPKVESEAPRSVPAPMAKAAPPPPAEPPRLKGLAAEALVDAFGAPTLKRREPPAEFWQYAGRSCVMYIFLYAPSDGAAMAVAHVEARDPAGERMESRACARRLAGEERPPARES